MDNVARTLTASPTDPKMWRRILALAHPDSVARGDHELFIWAQSLREHVAGDLPELPIHHHPRRTTNADSPRVPFQGDLDYDALTRRALEFAREVPSAYAWLLRLLSDCHPSHSRRLLAEQGRGPATRGSRPSATSRSSTRTRGGGGIGSLNPCR